MSDDFYTFVDSGDPAPDNAHLNGIVETGENEPATGGNTAAQAKRAMYAARIAVYDDMLSTPRVIVIEPQDVRTYLEETTNTVYRCMKEQGGKLSLMVIREIVENFIHAHFAEPIISILDGGNTIRFADQGPGIDDKERAFDFGVTSANRDMKRYIRGTGAGFPMVQEYLENAGGAVSIEDNMGSGTVVTVSLDPKRVAEIERAGGRGAAVRPENEPDPYTGQMAAAAQQQMQNAWQMQQGMPIQQRAMAQAGMQGAGWTTQQAGQPYGAYQPVGYQQQYPQPYMQPMQPAAQQYPQAPQPYGQNAPAVMPQGMQAWPQGYRQPGAPAFASYQQTAAQMMYPNQTNQFQPPMAPEPYINERGHQIIQYLLANGECGPTDLTRAYGSSNATWSREVGRLAEAGLVIKSGQKYHLTELARAQAASQEAGPQAYAQGGAPQNAAPQAMAPQATMQQGTGMQVPMQEVPMQEVPMQQASWQQGVPAQGMSPQAIPLQGMTPQAMASQNVDTQMAEQQPQQAAQQ